MKKLMEKIVVGLSVLTMLTNTLCFASGTDAEFGDLALETKISNTLVVCDTDFSSDEYVTILDGLTNADLVGKDYIPAYDVSDTFTDPNNNVVNMSQPARYYNDKFVPASMGSLFRDDGVHKDAVYAVDTYNPEGVYWPRPSGWYALGTNIKVEDGQLETCGSGTYTSRIVKTIQYFYRDYGPGKYKIEFKAKALNDAATGKNTQLHSKYNRFNHAAASYNIDGTDGTNGDSFAALSTTEWTTISTSITVPEVSSDKFIYTDTYTSDVFTFDLRGAGNSSFNFAIDGFRITKEVAAGDSVHEYAGKPVTLDHTVYANDKTADKEAVVITALYNADNGLVDVDTKPVSVAANVANVTTQTTVTVPANATADWYVRSYLWTDVTEDISPYSLSTELFDGNLIKNGSFEITENSTDNVAKYWSGRSGVPVVDSTYAHSGKYSIKVDSSVCATFQYTQFANDILPLGAGTYKMTFWAKTDAEAGMDIMGIFRSNGGANQGDVYTNIKASDGWVKYEVEHTAASFVDCGIILGSSSSPGTVWIDDVAVEKIN